MIDKNRALQIAYNKIRDYQIDSESDVRIKEDLIIEENFGWVFFYDTVEALNGDISKSLTGNAPLIVDRNTGEISETGTALTVDYYIKEYQESKGYEQVFKDGAEFYDRLYELKQEKSLYKKILSFFKIG